MTATLEDVRDAISDALDAIGLRCSPYLTDQINPPQAMVDVEGPTQVTFGQGGAVEYTFTVMVFDQRTSERSAQQRFDNLRDPHHARSVKRAIEDSSALAALAGVDYGLVDNPSRTSSVQFGAIDYLVVEFPLAVVIHEV